jgi:hypothetical protein
VFNRVPEELYVLAEFQCEVTQAEHFLDRFAMEQNIERRRQLADQLDLLMSDIHRRFNILWQNDKWPTEIYMNAFRFMRRAEEELAKCDDGIVQRFQRHIAQHVDFIKKKYIGIDVDSEYQ